MTKMMVACDSSSIFLILRIVPDLFTDPKFNCHLIPEIKRELIQTQKFNTKYTWKRNYKDKLLAVSDLIFNEKEFQDQFNFLVNFLDSGIVNQNTGKFFDLSYRDKLLATYCIHKGYEISTCDNNLLTLLKQEFGINNNFPLELINKWIKNNLIERSHFDHVQSIIQDWLDEPKQPEQAIEEYESLTNLVYPISK